MTCSHKYIKTSSPVTISQTLFPRKERIECTKKITGTRLINFQEENATGISEIISSNASYFLWRNINNTIWSVECALYYRTEIKAQPITETNMLKVKNQNIITFSNFEYFSILLPSHSISLSASWISGCLIWAGQALPCQGTARWQSMCAFRVHSKCQVIHVSFWWERTLF